MFGTPGGPGRLNQEPLFLPGKSRAGRGLRGTWGPARGAARGALVHRPRRSHRGPSGPGSRQWLLPVARGCLPTLSLGSTHLVLPPFRRTLVPASFLPATGPNFCPSLPEISLTLRNFCLLGESPGPCYRPLPQPCSAFSLAPGSSSPRTAVLFSRHSREFSSCRNALLPPPPPFGLGREGGGFRANLPRVLFYSFNSFTFPFLLCVTFTYLLIYNRSGSLPFPARFTVSVGAERSTSAPPGQLLPSTRGRLRALSLLGVS